VTYSIVARDPATGMLGLGIASHVLAVGRVALYVEPGVAAVVSQSLVLMAHGRRTLEGIAAGLDPEEALAASLALDDTPDVRQVGAVRADGAVAAHTGAGCIAHAGHVLGPDVACQANMMAGPGVPEAMAAAYAGALAADAPFVERLLAALDAAEAQGGDVRGRQSAALVVVGPNATGDPLVDRVVDVRVDDDPTPLVELRRLARLAVANHRLDVADGLLAAGEVAGAAAAYREATELAPTFTEFRFWQATALAAAGVAAGDEGDEAASALLDEALAAWAPLTTADDAERWTDLLGRVVAVGLVPAAAGRALLGEPDPPAADRTAADPVSPPPPAAS
jgi:uncharacterized Ntn-hydrolase superfamily protein